MKPPLPYVSSYFSVLTDFLLCLLALGLAAWKRSLYSLFPHKKGALNKVEVFSSQEMAAMWSPKTSSFYLSVLHSLAYDLPSPGYLLVAKKVLATPSVVFVFQAAESRRGEGKRALLSVKLVPLKSFPYFHPVISDIGHPNLQGRPEDVNCHF